LVEDDKGLCNTLERGLGEAGHVVESVHNGEEGIYYALNADYDVIVLDIMLPDISGLEVCKKLRGKSVSTPIIMLTAKKEPNDRVRGLDAGADDYLCKPFDFEELEARLRALQRRQVPNRSAVIKTAGISLNTITHEAEANNKKAALTPTEYRVLEYIMANPNRVLTRAMIEEHIWDISRDHESNIVDVFIEKLRHKLDLDPKTGPIRAVYGVGYRLIL
jgi:DNA-binding response OmpR family regulator